MDNEVLINEFEAAQAMPVVHVNLEESENNLLIDWESREIKFPEAMTNLGVRYDHRAKKIVFEMDRYVGEEDLAAHTFAVHYYNYDGKTQPDEANGGLHPITNLDVSRPDKILCEWSITNKSTQIPGYLVFALHIFSIVDKAYTYHISTVPAVKPLNDTVVATSHGSNIAPDEIEVYIQKMTALSNEIDNKIAGFTNDVEAKMTEMGALVERAEAAADKFVIEENLSYASENAVQNKVIAPRLFDLDRFKASAIIQKASGRNIVINDSAKAGIPWMRTLGKSEQDGLPTPEAPVPIVNAGQKIVDGWQLAKLPDIESAVFRGITWSCKNGIVAANGTATANSSTLNTGIFYEIPIVAGTYYVSGSGDKIKLYVYIEASDGDVLYKENASFSLDGTETACRLYCQVSNGVTVDATVYPMLNVGTTAKPWEPYTCGGYTDGSQLANFPDVAEVEVNGITWSCKNGVVTAKGTANSTSSTQHTNMTYNLPVIKGIYCLGPTGTDDVKLVAEITKADGRPTYTVSSLYATTFTLDGNEKSCRLFFQINSGITVDTTVYPMLNVGTEAKAWQPYTAGMKPVIDIPIETEVLGGNLWNSNDTVYFTAYDTYWQKNLVGWKIFANKPIKFLCNVHGFAPSGIRFWMYDYNGKLLVNSGLPFTRTFTQAEADSITRVAIVFEGLTSGTLYSGNFEVMATMDVDATEYQPYTYQSLPINKPNGFAGIEVTDTSLANYTDPDGKMWCCDERDWARGVDIQRILRKEYNGTEGWSLAERDEASGNTGIFYIGQDNLVKDNAVAVCSHYIWGQRADINPNSFDTHHRQIRFNGISMDYTVDDWKAQLAEWAANGTPLRTLTQLVTPIETPIPEEEMAAWRALHSNYPTTTILSNADTEVEYITDTKTYIDNKFAELAAAYVAGSEV